MQLRDETHTSKVQQDILLGVCMCACVYVSLHVSVCVVFVHLCACLYVRERERERMAVSAQADKTFSCSRAAGVCDDMVCSTGYCK